MDVLKFIVQCLCVLYLNKLRSFQDKINCAQYGISFSGLLLRLNSFQIFLVQKRTFNRSYPNVLRLWDYTHTVGKDKCSIWTQRRSRQTHREAERNTAVCCGSFILAAKLKPNTKVRLFSGDRGVQSAHTFKRTAHYIPPPCLKILSKYIYILSFTSLT